MSRLIRKHSLPTRLFHWLNGPLLLIMIWSGLMIYWAHDVYGVTIGGRTLIRFFPKWFYALFQKTWFRLDHRLAMGMAWHFTFMWLFAINGFLYVGYTIWSGEWRFLVPDRKSPREALDVVLHDLGIRKEPLPRRKFNAAQRIAYTSVILMGAGSLITGLAIYKPVQLGWLTWLLGGYPLARQWHFWFTISYLGFFLIHITQVVRAGWNNFRAMVVGVELAKEQEPDYAPVQAR